MGYELDRLTRHYGIPNALSSYGGFTAPTGATAEQAAAEATDRAAYKTYTDQLLARIGATPQYEKRQYNKNALANYWATVLQAPTYSDAPATVAPPPVAAPPVVAPPIPGVPVPGVPVSVGLHSGSGGGGYGYDAGTPSYDGPGFMSSVANGLGWAVDALDAYGYGKNPPGYQASVEDRMTGETTAGVIVGGPIDSGNAVGVGVGPEVGESVSGDYTSGAYTSPVSPGNAVGVDLGPLGPEVGESVSGSYGSYGGGGWDSGGYGDSGYGGSSSGESGGYGGGDGMDGGWARGGFVSLANKYKIRDYRHGGLVGMEKGYSDGGEVESNPESGGFTRYYDSFSGPGLDSQAAPMEAVLDNVSANVPAAPLLTRGISPSAAKPTPAPSAALQNLQQVTAQHSTGGNTAELMRMLASQKSPYADEYKQAKTARSESEMKFQQMLTKAMEQKSDAPSKSEMYFRLAAAFGAPTKTGSFGESLGSAASAMGDYSKEMRIADTANRASRQQLAIMGAQLDLTGKRTEQSELRQLMGADTTSQKALALTLLKEQFAAGKPQSEAGKVALDAGLIAGTTEYTAFVQKYIKDKLESGDWLKQAMLTVAQANQATAASREDRAKAAAARLTPAALKMKDESQGVLGSLDDAMGTLSRAYSLNPNTFEGTLRDTLSRKLLEQTDPKDPRVIAHREQANLLGKGALAKLKATFGGNISDGERLMLLDFEGLDAKSREERGAIMKNAYRLLKLRKVREQKKFDDISSGKYNEVTPVPEIERD